MPLVTGPTIGSPHVRAISRRAFLITTGGAVVLAACGGGPGDGGRSADTTSPGDTSSSRDGATTLPPGGSTGDAVLVRFFSDGVLAAGTPQRLPFGLGDANGVLTTGGPEQLEIAVIDGSGAVVTTATVPRHAEGLPRPYWPLSLALTTTGIYTASVETASPGQKSGTATAAFTISPTEQVAIPKVGEQLIAVDTPTVTDARGVTPICTRDPACPLHEVTLTEALASGRPVAVLIGTPAYCQTGTCGPVLDVLLGQRDQHPDVVMVHAEIYKDPERALSSSATATSGGGADLGEVTEAVQAYELPFEPVLYAAGADGVIRARLDSIYDGTELGAVLAGLS
jgi:hypothetical protein